MKYQITLGDSKGRSSKKVAVVDGEEAAVAMAWGLARQQSAAFDGYVCVDLAGRQNWQSHSPFHHYLAFFCLRECGPGKFYGDREVTPALRAAQLDQERSEAWGKIPKVLALWKKEKKQFRDLLAWIKEHPNFHAVLGCSNDAVLGELVFKEHDFPKATARLAELEAQTQPAEQAA